MASTGSSAGGADDRHRRDVERELAVARHAARSAGKALRDQFGSRLISAAKGPHDVQLRADVTAQDIIARQLRAEFPDYGVVAEEEPYTRWPDTPLTWAVDPLDGTNNFGFGIAHCAIAISLFERERVVLALVFDPLLDRECFAVDAAGTVGGGDRARPPAPPAEGVPLRQAVISLVTNYSDGGHAWFRRADALAAERCRRAVNLWAPALDLALVAEGVLDGMVCHGGYLLDVCGGLFLVQAAGGCVLDPHGHPTTAERSRHDEPISFVAARSPELARELLDAGFLAE
ncbi:inositol monophosphatase [Streptomyces sp. SAJ15]|uniref:inositol monophosphatase family protein n=1 Tax=Streptomyces sp. SAJ15 TaxID=2011095 RepID=UPI0011857384|nr:inositol monophosphatase [Streptomyces sp. SAJ15]TVL87825.1 hypothetical protein CD790_32600 [Streptomyces sp. SAJ15]